MEFCGDLHWIKSSASAAMGECVEVALLPTGEIAVRDSKSPGGPVLIFQPVEWRSFIVGVKLNEFDLVPPALGAAPL